MMLPRMLSPYLRRGSTVEQRVVGMMAASSARAVADGARGLAQRPASFSLLPTISVPTLVVVGEHDQLTPPEDSEAIAAGVPGARLEKIDQAGHMANMENPEAFNEVLLAFVDTIG
jgi:3-oxoadipate enol-lactonase